jgi:hypothetical protein
MQGQRMRHHARAREVLADLHRRRDRGGQLRAARVIVVAQRLLDPVQPFAVERAAALQRLGRAQRLVVIGHE